MLLLQTQATTTCRSFAFMHPTASAACPHTLPNNTYTNVNSVANMTRGAPVHDVTVQAFRMWLSVEHGGRVHYQSVVTCWVFSQMSISLRPTANCSSQDRHHSITLYNICKSRATISHQSTKNLLSTYQYTLTYILELPDTPWCTFAYYHYSTVF